MINNEFAKRFRDFRVKFIDKLQIRAAEKLHISKGQLSNIESGRKRPNIEIIEVMIRDFNLNTEWLATGNGNKQTTGPAKPTAGSGLAMAHTDILMLRKVVMILDANLNHAIKTIGTLTKRIEALESKNK